jgi:ABC-2 type transport system ATP-binding protein
VILPAEVGDPWLPNSFSMRATLVAAALAAIVLVVAPEAGAAPTLTNGCTPSVPEPGGEQVEICWSLYRPDGADATHPVPLVLHSHGWGGSRTNDPTAFGDWLDAGFGVLSFDQRGFGASGGEAHVEHPDFEGQDVQRLVDVVAELDWVAEERPGDPVLGAIGGSYGGGYQLVGAYTELRDRGDTRFDALAPEITWWDLRESLAPSRVARTAWITALYAAGAPAHTAEVHRGFLYGAATGEWPTGQTPLTPNLDWFFAKNGPAWHAARGRLLDIPMVFGQGTTDNLFNLNQGLKIRDHGLTESARARSIFVAYNGGHALPSLAPVGTQGSGDPCSEALGGGSFSDLTRRFFAEELQGAAPTLGGRGAFHLATPEARCVTVDAVTPTTTWTSPQVLSTAGAGAPLATEIAKGPLTVAGLPTLSANVTTTSTEARVFAALAVGTSPLDARIVQNNMMPIRVVGPTTGGPASVKIELPAVAVDVPEGSNLYLVLSPVSDLSFGHGSRVPGAVVLRDVVVSYRRV